MWPKHPTSKDYPDLPLIEGDEIVQLGPDQAQLTRMYTERAVGFIEKNRERPFFLYLAHSMPHLCTGSGYVRLLLATGVNRRQRL